MGRENSLFFQHRFCFVIKKRRKNKQQKMDEFKSEMDELKRAMLASHQQIEKEFNEKLEKMIEDQQQQQSTTMPSMLMSDNSKMANLNQQAIKVSNSACNRWDKILIQLQEEEFDGEHLYVSTDDVEWHNVFALNGFPISLEHCGSGTDLSTAGKTIYYYEVVQRWPNGDAKVGLSGGLPADYIFGDCHPNFYYLEDDYHHCCLSGTKHELESSNWVIKPEWESDDSRSRADDVIGCGILFNSNDKLFIFFTLNGNLIGKPIPITPSVDYLYPTVRIWGAALEANFGYDPAKPFKFDIGKCPELELQ